LESGPRHDGDSLTLMKADALDLALMRLEPVDGSSDCSAETSEERRAPEVGIGPDDVLVPFDEVVPKVGKLDPTARATAPLGGHGWRSLADDSDRTPVAKTSSEPKSQRGLGSGRVALV